MKILLIGAGAVGSVVSGFLSRDKDVSEVICASNDIGRAREFVEIKNPKIRLASLDASNIGEIISRAKGADLIINASLPRFNENIMEAALRVGANYQDLASELADSKTAEQLKFHEKFKRAKLTALINAGVAPGVSNLLAREAADKLDSVDTIHFRCLEDHEAADEFVTSWSAKTTVDSLAYPPLVYRKGRFIFTKPFGDAEEYDFPRPFGRRRVFSIFGDEVATVPLFVKVRNADFKSGGADTELFKTLFGLGLFSEKPVLVGGKKTVPLDFFRHIMPDVPVPARMKQLVKSGALENAVFVLAVEVIGKRRGKRAGVKINAVFPDLKRISKKFPGATYISYPTGATAYAFSKIIPKMKSFGVFPPEALDRYMRKAVMLELERKGTVISGELRKIG